MTLANALVGGLTASGGRTVLSCVPTSIGPNTILLLSPGSLPLPTGPETG
jgi:hypothetical protein